MKQVLLYKFNPQQMLDLLEGRLSIGVFKRDLPQWAKDKIDRGEILQGYGYCTKGKPYLYAFNGTYIIDGTDKGSWGNVLNGLVVVKFQVSGSDKIYDYHIVDGTVRVSSIYETDNLLQDELLDKACLTLNQISNYVGMNDSYAHHFTNIQPVHMELGEFFRDYDTLDTDSYGRYIGWYDIGINPLTKPPQSFMTCWVKGE